MPARTKGRAKFDFRGRPFIWWVDADYYLRIASLDKKFITAYPMGIEWGDPPVIEVIGSEFPGLDASESRPIWIVAPRLSGESMGAKVDQLLAWSFNPAHELIRSDAPPFIGQFAKQD